MFSRIFMMIIFATTALGMNEEEITDEDTKQAMRQPIKKRRNAFLVERKYQNPSAGLERIVERVLKRAAAKGHFIAKKKRPKKNLNN